MDVARHGLKRPASPSDEQDYWKTASPVFETTTVSFAETAGAAAAHMVDITSDRSSNEDIEDSSPKRTCCIDNLLDSNHPPQTSPGPSTSHNALSNSSAPPSIEVEESDISIWTTRPAYLRLLKPLRDDSPDLSAEEHVPVLQRFFNLVIDKPSRGFVGTLADLALQFWDLMEAYCARRDYSSRVAKDSCVNVFHLPVRRMKMTSRVALVILNASLPLVFHTSCAEAVPWRSASRKYCSVRDSSIHRCP